MWSLCGYSVALKASRVKVLFTRAVGSRSAGVGSLDADGASGSCCCGCGLLSIPAAVFCFFDFFSFFSLGLDELVIVPVVIVPMAAVLGSETAEDASAGGGGRMESGTRGSKEFRARTSNWRGLLRTMLAATDWDDAMEMKEEES